MSGVAAARSIFRSSAVRNGAARFASSAKASRSPFRMSTRTPLANRLFSCPCELSSMQPFHTATASALMTSMLTLSHRGYGWLPEASSKPLPMSDTMSSPTDNWAHYYQPNAPARPVGLFTGNQISDATTVTANAISSASGGGLSPEGRVSKPVRKRSRASRRTPTTLLNTDTANFRAMVQQFTGGSLAPFPSSTGSSSSSSSYPVGTNFSLGIGSGQQYYANPDAVMVPRPGYTILQGQQQLQHQQQHQFMFPKTDDDHHAYLRGMERSTLPHMDASGGAGFRMDGVSSSVPPIIRSSSSTQEDSYML